MPGLADEYCLRGPLSTFAGGCRRITEQVSQLFPGFLLRCSKYAVKGSRTWPEIVTEIRLVLDPDLLGVVFPAFAGHRRIIRTAQAADMQLGPAAGAFLQAPQGQ